MNARPRALNRTLLILGGIIALAVAVAGIGASIAQPIRDLWQSGIDAARTGLPELLQRTPLGDTGRSWLWIVLLAASLIVIALAITLISQQRRGRERTLVVADGADVTGRIELAVTVASDALVPELTALPDVLGARVSGHRMIGHRVGRGARATTGLRITVTTRKGADPTAVARAVERIVGLWDAELGAQAPVLLEIRSGWRSARSATRRTDVARPGASTIPTPRAQHAAAPAAPEGSASREPAIITNGHS